MAQCNSYVRLSYLQLNKLKCAVKNETEVVLSVSSNMIGNSNNKIAFPHDLLLTHRQVTDLHFTILRNWSTDNKLSKAWLS